MSMHECMWNSKDSDWHKESLCWSFILWRDSTLRTADTIHYAGLKNTHTPMGKKHINIFQFYLFSSLQKMHYFQKDSCPLTFPDFYLHQSSYHCFCYIPSWGQEFAMPDAATRFDGGDFIFRPHIAFCNKGQDCTILCYLNRGMSSISPVNRICCCFVSETTLFLSLFN